MSTDRLVLVLASANRHKAIEMREILSELFGTALELRDRPSTVGDIEEDGTSLEENARIKARAICEATGLAAVADDTGLEVDALGGAPGIYAARYAGPHATFEDNVHKLLRELEGVTDRSARFATVVLVAFPDGTEISARGQVEGVISMEQRGDGGHGYDPIFVPEGAGGRTFSEMSPAEKHLISHRGRAIRALAELLAERVNGVACC